MAKKLKRRALLVLTAGTLIHRFAFTASSDPKTLSTRIDSSANQTRLTLEFDQNIKFRYFTLNNPDRLVIDLQGLRQSQSLAELSHKLSRNDAFVRNVRLGQKSNDTVRMVLDLKQNGNARVVALKPAGRQQHRIQIDIGTASANNNPRGSANANNDDPLRDIIAQNQRRQPAHTPQPTARTDKNRTPVIVLDAGHGGKDPGATGPNGTKEKDVALATTLELRQQLQAKGYIVHLTRSGDQYIPLRERRQKARQVQADLFISIHANTNEVVTLRGADVYIWGQANSERVRKLAQAENDADLVDGVAATGNKDVDSILSDMMQSQTTADSTRLGNLMLRQMGKNAMLHKRTVEQGNFVVLRSLDIPSVLVEMAFLSNPQDEKMLNSSQFRRQMASNIADAVQMYLRHATLN